MTTADKISRAIERKYGDIGHNAAAQRLGMSPGTLSEWLTGKYEPTLGSLRVLARKLSCRVQSLVGDEAKAS